jgi:hypothetical protein
MPSPDEFGLAADIPRAFDDRDELAATVRPRRGRHPRRSTRLSTEWNPRRPALGVSDAFEDRVHV